MEKWELEKAYIVEIKPYMTEGIEEVERQGKYLLTMNLAGNTTIDGDLCVMVPRCGVSLNVALSRLLLTVN